MILIYACAYTGVIAVPVDSTRFSHELEHILDKVRPTGIILMAMFDGINYADQFERDFILNDNAQQSKRFPDLKHVIRVKKFVNYPLESTSDDYLSTMLDYDDVFSNDPSIYSFQLPETNPHDPFIILFTVCLVLLSHIVNPIDKILFFYMNSSLEWHDRTKKRRRLNIFQIPQQLFTLSPKLGQIERLARSRL